MCTAAEHDEECIHFKSIPLEKSTNSRTLYLYDLSKYCHPNLAVEDPVKLKHMFSQDANRTEHIIMSYDKCMADNKKRQQDRGKAAALALQLDREAREAELLKNTGKGKTKSKGKKRGGGHAKDPAVLRYTDVERETIVKVADNLVVPFIAALPDLTTATKKQKEKKLMTLYHSLEQ